MKTRAIILLVVTSIFCSPAIFAQYTDNQAQDDEAAPPGMETRRVNNDVTVLLPAGGKMHTLNKSTFVQESSDEYSSRNFSDIYGRLARLEEENRQLVDAVMYLKSKLVLQDKSADKNGSKPAEE